ncbi:MAG: vWA domain-containing protein [Chloroflexota bacterium]
MAQRRSRRSRASRRGSTLDLRRSLRLSLRHGGEMVQLAHRRPKMKRRQLVLLCDISGSMERYTRLLLHFSHALESSAQRTEVFVFGTRLTRISRQLRSSDPDVAIQAVTRHVPDWSGGTRIGEVLSTFNHRWARRVLGNGAIVMIISDGWDRGDPAHLAAEMQRLRRSSYRLVWLNPLLGSIHYRPLTQGIQAALPYVDDFLPVHSLESLASLASLLNQIQEGRPDRRHISSRSEASSTQ